MRPRSAVNTTLLLAVLGFTVSGCATKEKDPLDEIKSLIPVVEQRLNKRDLAGLKGMGTVQFESNALVIDVFGEHVRDTVHLALSQILQTGSDATLILDMSMRPTMTQGRKLVLELKGGERWRIDSYRILTPDTDSSGAGS